MALPVKLASFFGALKIADFRFQIADCNLHFRLDILDFALKFVFFSVLSTNLQSAF
jgi:hypothetical protein